MSTAALATAFTSQVTGLGSLQGTTLSYLDGGRVQLLSFTIIPPSGARVTISRMIPAGADLTAAAVSMAADYKAGTLTGI